MLHRSTRASQSAGARRSEDRGSRNSVIGSGNVQSRIRSLKVKERLFELLNCVAGTGIPGIDRLAAGESFVLPVIISYAVFCLKTKEINFFVVDDRWKVQQPDIQVFDQAAGLKYAIE